MNTQKTNIAQFEYQHLDPAATQQFIRAISRLFDAVFETPERDFEKFTDEEENLREYDAAELFRRYFEAIKPEELTKYQRQFYDFATVNITTIFKWYKKNSSSINISPRQLEWFKRWMKKHGVGHEFLNELDPEYRRSITPQFRRLFDVDTVEQTAEGEI